MRYLLISDHDLLQTAIVPLRWTLPLRSNTSPRSVSAVDVLGDGVCLCVSNGSGMDQEWAGAAGFQLMKAASIYLLLNILRIHTDGCLFFHFYMLRQAIRLFTVSLKQWSVQYTQTG